MSTVTVNFLRYMAIDRKCQVCHRRYLAVMEEEHQGVCGECLSIAYPSPMEEEFLPVRQLVREIQEKANEQEHRAEGSSPTPSYPSEAIG